MEIAVPLLALGSLYVASNQKKIGPVNENYTNMGERRRLPNTNIPETNYPVVQPGTGSNVNQYLNPNTPTDRYYGLSQEKYNKIIEAGGTQFGDAFNNNAFQSLSGQTIDTSEFKHANMVPFFGAKIRGRTADSVLSENILDNKVGAGSQSISKGEMAPLFAPQENMKDPHGMKNYTDFYQSRMVPSSRMSNVKPWESERVGPGLDKGFGNEGSMGFNSGMDAREKWLDRGVDELRVKTNPKLTYSLENHQGPAGYFIPTVTDAAAIGRVEKNLPDTYFVNTPDRWLTTTGAEKAQMGRAMEVERDVNRTTTTTEYYGGTTAANVGSAMTAPENYEPDKRNNYDGLPMINPYAGDSAAPSAKDYGRDSYTMLPNNRTTVREQEPGGIHGALRAVVAPLLDVLRPSRKENVTGNARPYGGAGSTVPAAITFNPADRLPTTIKETTTGLLGFDHLNVGERTTNAGYLVTPQQTTETERQSTSTDYIGAASGHPGVQVYNAAYNQRNNVNKTYKSRTNQGNMSLFNSNNNIRVSRLDGDRNNNRWWVPSNGPVQTPSVEVYGRVSMPQAYDNTINQERINPELLNAFRSNPYTHSLHTY